MSWRTRHDGLQQYNSEPEDLVQLVDIGGGVAGLPALDGSNLTGVESFINHSITAHRTIPSGSTLLANRASITDGTTISIEDGGVWLHL